VDPVLGGEVEETEQLLLVVDELNGSTGGVDATRPHLLRLQERDRAGFIT
jgi:hypothetical protein